MTTARIYNTGTSAWDAVTSGPQGTQGVQGPQGTQGAQGGITTNAVLTGPFEQAVLPGTYLGSSVPAGLNAASGTFYVYGAAGTGNFAVNMTNVPTTPGVSVTFAMMLTQGSTPYIPSSISINGTATAASGLPANQSSYNNIYTWWQGGTAPTSGDASTVNTWTFTIICISSGVYFMLAAQTKF